jgi:hypothetical protein
VVVTSAAPRPRQPWPPALVFECPDDDGWSWHANDARGYEAKLERAWSQHRREQHHEVGGDAGDGRCAVQQVLW